MGESIPHYLTPFDSSNIEKGDFPRKHEIFVVHNYQQSSEYKSINIYVTLQ